jgi:hypothetical protein
LLHGLNLNGKAIFRFGFLFAAATVLGLVIFSLSARSKSQLSFGSVPPPARTPAAADESPAVPARVGSGLDAADPALTGIDRRELAWAPAPALDDPAGDEEELDGTSDGGQPLAVPFSHPTAANSLLTHPELERKRKRRRKGAIVALILGMGSLTALEALQGSSGGNPALPPVVNPPGNPPVGSTPSGPPKSPLFPPHKPPQPGGGSSSGGSSNNGPPNGSGSGSGGGTGGTGGGTGAGGGTGGTGGGSGNQPPTSSGGSGPQNPTPGPPVTGSGGSGENPSSGSPPSIGGNTPPPILSNPNPPPLGSVVPEPDFRLLLLFGLAILIQRRRGLSSRKTR